MSATVGSAAGNLMATKPLRPRLEQPLENIFVVAPKN